MQQSAIVSSHFSTNGLRASDQFDAWREYISVIFDVVSRREHSSDGFIASIDAFQLGDILVAVSNLEAQRYIRSTRRIHGDQIDHFQISLYTSGGWDCDSIVGPVHGQAGQICVVDLAQPLVSDEPHSDIITVIVPRDLLEYRLPDISTLHGRSPTGPFAAVLADYFGLLARRLPTLVGENADEMDRATCDMLVACLRPSIANSEIARNQIDAVLARRAKRQIERELTSPDLSVESITKFLGVSRRTLYRVFEPTGGIQKYILGKRLDSARNALLDHTHRQKISEIAEEFGFTRMDYFSRVFKNRFGQSPADISRSNCLA